jgi:hypothetical protein
MTESETIAFLEEHGVARVDPDKWQPHQPVLYVMEEIIRHHENGPFNDLSRDKRPSIVRVHDPLKIHFDEPRGDADRTIYWLESNRGQVDYYVIDAVTGKPELVQTKYSHKIAPNAYHVRKEVLFNAADDLFPRAQK